MGREGGARGKSARVRAGQRGRRDGSASIKFGLVVSPSFLAFSVACRTCDACVVPCFVLRTFSRGLPVVRIIKLTSPLRTLGARRTPTVIFDDNDVNRNLVLLCRILIHSQSKSKDLRLRTVSRREKIRKSIIFYYEMFYRCYDVLTRQY